MGVGIEPVKTALSRLKGVKGRFEIINTSRDFSVILDFAHTPDGLEKIMLSAREFCRGRLIVVFGCGGDRDRAKRPIMGNIASTLGDICIITSDNPRNEEPLSIIKDIIKGIIEKKDRCVIIEDRKEAIREALLMAQRDDVVIIAGKGHEAYQIIGDEVIPFDESEIIRSILEEEKIQWS